jgi:hypothetical protein
VWDLGHVELLQAWFMQQLVHAADCGLNKAMLGHTQRCEQVCSWHTAGVQAVVM